LRGWRTRWFWVALRAEPVASSASTSSHSAALIGRRRNLSSSTGPQHDRHSL
jgi:hypothetical protein